MAKRPKPKILPFNKVPGEFVASGQDNAVYRLSEPADVPHLRVPTGYVVKVSHEYSDATKMRRQRHSDDVEATKLGTQYKKNKYDILKRFLGDHIPESFFVVGDAVESGVKRPVEYTIQKEVPRFGFTDLSIEQKTDPRLAKNLKHLMTKLKYMYEVVGQANARMSHDINLDAKLDLGGISDFVRSEDIDHVFDDSDVNTIINTNNHPIF